MTSESKNNIPEMERRFHAAPLDVRGMDGKKGKRVGGYAARFGSKYDMGWFTEEIAPGAFDGAEMSDVVALFNHDPNVPLGRSTAGTLKISLDRDGLAYEIDLPDSPNGENVGAAIERGDVTQSSWGFSIDTDEWRMVDGKDHRTITKVRRIWDVSPVTFPANPDTSVAKRSRAQHPPDGGDDDTDIFKSAQRARRLRLLALEPR